MAKTQQLTQRQQRLELAKYLMNFAKKIRAGKMHIVTVSHTTMPSEIAREGGKATPVPPWSITFEMKAIADKP